MFNETGSNESARYNVCTCTIGISLPDIIVSGENHSRSQRNQPKLLTSVFPTTRYVCVESPMISLSRTHIRKRLAYERFSRVYRGIELCSWQPMRVCWLLRKRRIRVPSRMHNISSTGILFPRLDESSLVLVENVV